MMGVQGEWDNNWWWREIWKEQQSSPAVCLQNGRTNKTQHPHPPTILAHWQVGSNLQTSNMSTMRNPADSSDSLSYRILTAGILIHFDLILLLYVAYYNAAWWMRLKVWSRSSARCSHLVRTSVKHQLWSRYWKQMILENEMHEKFLIHIKGRFSGRQLWLVNIFVDTATWGR